MAGEVVYLLHRDLQIQQGRALLKELEMANMQMPGDIRRAV
jgi:hypothetical protein